MLCDDENEYVVKFPIPGWSRALVNEGLGGRFAQELHLPMPDFAVVELPGELVVSSPHLQGRGVQPGRYFGTRRVPGAFNFMDGRVGSITPEHIVNRDSVAPVIGFDNFLLNHDRNNAGNVLIRPETHEGGPLFRLFMIDNGFILGGPDWAPATLAADHAMNGLVDCLPFLRQCIYDLNEFEPFVDRAEGMNEAGIESICSEVPAEWNLSETDRVSIRQFLLNRRAQLRARLLAPASSTTYPNLRWF